tara:strand:+ start:95 stop:214 length:120 start_codon:yes stop_codon:yes gene_type:complete
MIPKNSWAAVAEGKAYQRGLMSANKFMVDFLSSKYRSGF